MNKRDSVVDAHSPREVIEQKTRDEIEVYLAGRGKSSIHESARNLSQNVSDDYGNRFLVELIQNAHDAHEPGERDGRIAIVFDPAESEFGCLYVANRGNGFSAKNFLALTNIALSSKPVNESIGNKGLGFRSVLQVSQWPEVYSVDDGGSQGQFDGFCFRFADREDVAKFLGLPEADALADEILENMPCWYLPVYASDRPGLVSRFAGEGFSSVVRIPLVSQKARDLVHGQFDELLNREHPLHLFLDRIASISLEREPGKVQILERHILERWQLETGKIIEKVRIGADEYLVATHELDQERFRQQLDQSVSRKEVPESWKNWQGSAQVSVAVRLGRSVANGLMFCFLPLGAEGKAPFAGYINANFYTKMDRRSVNDGVGLNKYFIDTAAGLSCRAIKFLVEQNWPEAPGAVVDLLCWDSPYSTIIHRGLGGIPGDFLNSPLLPTRASEGGTRWSSVRNTYIWMTPSESCLSTKTITRVADAPILHESLTDNQRTALERFFLLINVNFKPPAVVIAGWVEKVAEDMLVLGASTQRWADFYDEVAFNLRRDPSVLFGKRFLLSVNRELIAAQVGETSSKRRRAADIYFPPVRSVDGDGDHATAIVSQLPLEQLPASLQKGFAFLSREIPWLNEKSGYRPARSFFLEARLVREYNTRDIVRTLAGITQSDVDEPIKEQALGWAFRLWSSGVELSEKETRAAAIFVPTRAGWRSAESAMFGSGWPTCSNGKRLESFIKSAAEYSAELAAQQGCLVQLLADWSSNFGGTDEDWVRFLIAAGVRDFLRPVAEDRIQKDGQPLSLAFDLAASVPVLPTTAREIWRRSLDKHARTARFSTVIYRSDLVPWRLPGQCDVENFPNEVRKEFAAQVVKAISGLSDPHLKFRVYRPGNPSSGPATEHWPTPLMSLLNDTSWLPVVRGTPSLRFVRPNEGWYFNSEEEVAPRFVELVAQSVSKFMDDGVLEWLRTKVGLRILNDERDAVPALSVYADIARQGLNDSREVKRFRELFGEVWTRTAHLDTGLDLACIPVVVGDQIDALVVDATADGQVLSPRIGYFIDEDDAAKQKLLEELNFPVFNFGKANPEDTWGWLEVLAPDRFVKLSEERLDVLVDGTRYDGDSHPPLLSSIFGPWIIDFIVCVAGHKGPKFFQATQTTLAKVRRSAMSLRILTGKHLQISMAGVARDLPGALQGAVVLWPAEGAVLIAQTIEPRPTLELLSRISDQLAAALRYQMLASALDAAFLRLSTRVQGAEFDRPDDEDIADVLGTSVTEIEQTRQYVRADLTSHVRFAGVLAATLGASDAQEFLAELAAEDDPTEEAILAGLAPVAGKLDLTVDKLVERLGRVSDPRDLMQEFDLSLAELNGAIRAHFPEFHPISNEVAHRRQLAAYLSEHGGQYAERLRQAYLDRFDSGEALDEYVRLRDLVSKIEPDTVWFERYDDLDHELLKAHVAAWFKEQGVIDAQIRREIPALKDSREANAAKFREFWQRFGKVLSAWVRSGSNEVSSLLLEAWIDPAAKQRDYLLQASTGGWFDFRLLDDAAIVQRLIGYGIWPTDKPISTDLVDWGITEASLHESEVQIDQERESARLRRLRINLDGQELSAVKGDYDKILAAVVSSFADAQGLQDISRGIRKLADADLPPGGGGGGGGSGKRHPDSTLSDDQKKAVGLIGEIYAQEWIRRFHREEHELEIGDNCWVSEYRDAILDTQFGDDKLGYDFIVRRKSVTHYYEVKASMGDSRVFEMGPTEIAAAHRYKTDKEHKYRVLYVSNATDHKRMAISLLPNPFSKGGSQKLRAVGKGSVTFAFNYQS